MTTLNQQTRQILNDSVGKFLAAEYDFQSRRAIVASEAGYSKTHWQQFAELGWLGIPFAQESGGLGGSALDCLDLCRAFGRNLVVEPYLSACGASAAILQSCANTAAAQILAPAVVAGELIVSLAHTEVDARGNRPFVKTKAERTAQGYHLRGNKNMVVHAPIADKLIVTARLSGNVAESEGIALFLVDADSAGLEQTVYTSVDGHRAANFQIDVLLPPEALLDERYQTLANALQAESLMQIAEGLGAMEHLLDTTLEYTRVRKQFGTPISSFQAIRHRLADMYFAYHQANNLLAQTLEDYGEGALPDHALSLLKLQFQRSAKYIGEQSIQLHGGIGMTDELAVGHYAKRLIAISTIMGSARLHLQEVWAGTQSEISKLSPMLTDF